MVKLTAPAVGILAPGETAGLLRGEFMLTWADVTVGNPLEAAGRLAVSAIGRTVLFRPAAQGVVRMLDASIGERPSC